MAETGAANMNTRSGPKHKRRRGHIHSHPDQRAARPLPLLFATSHEASLQRSWLRQRIVQVIVAPEQVSGRSMPDPKSLVACHDVKREGPSMVIL